MRRFICRLIALASRGVIGDTRRSRSFLKVFALTFLLIHGATPGFGQSNPPGPFNYQAPLDGLGLFGNPGKVAGRVVKHPGSARAAQTNFSVTGTWDDSLANVWKLTQDKPGNISGTVDLGPTGGCPCGMGMCGGSGHSSTWAVSGTENGPNFALNAFNPASGQVCSSVVNVTMTIAQDGMTANGSYVYAVGSGSLFMTLTLTCATILNGGQLLVDGDTLADVISGVPTINQNGVIPFISAVFTPGVNGGPIPMSQAYQLCKYTHFDWTQTINFLPDPSPFFQNTPGGPVRLTSASTPFPDPPPGGYAGSPGSDGYPYYYNPQTTLSAYETPFNLAFQDAAADPCILDQFGNPSLIYMSSPLLQSDCDYTHTAPGAILGFTTNLVGIKSDGTSEATGISFSWVSNYNGVSGGHAVTFNLGGVDAGSGVGGATVLGATQAAPTQGSAPGSAPGPVTTSLPHVADGNGFDTEVLLINTGGTDAAYTLQFFNQAGAPVTYPLDPTQGLMAGTIHPGGQTIVRTAGSGSTTHAGSGQLTAPLGVKGMVIYQQQASATSFQEGSAPIASTSTHFFVPFDNTNNATTPVGFVNSSTSQASTVAMTVRYATGGTDVIPSFSMNSMQQIAEPVTSLWSPTAGKRGMIEVTSIQPLGLVAFRFQDSAFTLVDTIAATDNGATAVTSTIAHSADGNEFKSTLVLTNSGTAAAPYTLAFYGATGQTQTFGFDVSNPLSGTVPAGSTLTIDTTGLGNTTNLGWAQLTAPPAVSGIEIFRQTNPGQSEQQATVPISRTNFTNFYLPFDNVGNTTSIALANPDPAITPTIAVTFRCTDGTSVTGQLRLPPRNYTANLLAAMFPATAGKAGVAEFISTIPISVVEVRFNPTQAFTSLRAVSP